MNSNHPTKIIWRIALIVFPIAAFNQIGSASAELSPTAFETWPEVILAVDQANQEGAGIIRLASRSKFIVTEPLPVMTGDIIIEGNGAKLESSPGYHGALVQVSSTASLRMEDLHIAGFDRKSLQGPVNYPALIDNYGTLKLNRVTLAENPSCQPCTESLPMLDNRGTAWLNNVTLYQNYTISPSPTANIRNCGSIEILNSTFAQNEAYQAVGITGVPMRIAAAILGSIPGSCDDGNFEIGNSLFDNPGGNCGELSGLVDLGGNFDSDGSCGFDPTSSVAHQPSVLGTFGLHGGLVPTVGLEPTSRAIDIAANEHCSATDARLASRPAQGRVGVEPACDAGAFELGGGFGNADLTVNGMNGLWYNAATDGHYVHVLRVSPDRVYINWTTFDQNANQLWLLAVATVANSNTLSATAYVNTGASLMPGGAPVGHTVEEWGEIELTFDDCLTGTFRYRANDTGFGEGQFGLDRLAYVEGGGCTNPENGN